MEWLEEALLPYWQYAKRTRRRTKIIVLAGGLLLVAEGRHRAVCRSAAAVYQGLADIVAGYYEEKDRIIRHIDDDDGAYQAAAEEEEVQENNNTSPTSQEPDIEQTNNNTPLEAPSISPIEENISSGESDSDDSMQTAHSSMPSSKQSSMASLDLAAPEVQREPHPAIAIAIEYRNKQKQMSTPLPLLPLEPLILEPQKSVKPPSPLVLRALLAAQGEDAFNFLEDLNVEFSDDDLPFG